MPGKKRRGPLNRVTQQVRAQPESGPVVRLLAWLVAHPVALMALGGAGFGLVLLLTKAYDLITSARAFFLFFGCAWLLGMFLMVALMTIDERRYAHSGGAIRTACGAVAAAGMAVLLGGATDAVLLAGLVGALLGSLARYWVFAL